MTTRIGFCFSVSLCVALAAAGCGQRTEAPAAPLVSSVDQGRQVSMILLKTLQAGTDKVGDAVPLAVIEDVTDSQGHVLIEKGALAEGKITWSRSEGTLSGLMNKPARLAITVDEVRAADGSTIKLTADPEGRAGEALQLTRDNTSPEGYGAKLDEAMNQPEQAELLKKLEESFREGQNLDLSSGEQKQVLTELAESLGLSSTRQVLQEGKLNDLEHLMTQVKRGGTAGSLLTGGSSTSLAALVELANVAGEVGSKLSRMLKGRTIRAYAGTPIQTTVVEDAQVTVRSGS